MSNDMPPIRHCPMCLDAADGICALHKGAMAHMAIMDVARRRHPLRDQAFFCAGIAFVSALVVLIKFMGRA